MKNLLHLLICIFISINSYSQHVQWASSVNSPELTQVIATSLDEDYNLTVIGHFEQDLWLSDDFQLTSAGNYDVFIAKYNSDGQVYWARNYGGSNDETPLSIEADADGNIFYLTDFSGTTSIDGTELTSMGSTDAYLAKLNSEGELSWTVQFGSSTYDYAVDVALDDTGNSYVAGFFSGTLNIGDQTISSNGQTDSFVVKIDPNGNVLWISHFGTFYNEQGHSLCLDADGNIYLTGNFEQSTNFNGVTYSSYGLRDGFVACYDNSGNEIWFKKIGGSSYDSGSDIEISSDGNLIVCGGYSYSVSIDDLNEGDGVNSGGMFVLKCDLNGDAIWLSAINGAAAGRAVSSDLAGNVYAGSFFSGTITVGGTVLSTGSNYQICIIKYDALGNQIWARKEGGSGYAFTGDLAGGVADEYFLAGDYSGTLEFGVITLAPEDLGETESFVGKFSATPLNQVELSSFSETTIYPNPSSGELWVEGLNISKIVIHNALGELVYVDSSLGLRSKITLNEFDSGLYLVSITLENGSVENHKLLVQKSE